jgi:hypothetical protein
VYVRPGLKAMQSLRCADSGFGPPVGLVPSTQKFQNQLDGKCRHSREKTRWKLTEASLPV